MVKVIVVILVLAGLALFAAYQWGGFSSFDPTEQGREAKAAIAPGMQWTKVVDLAGEPGHYRIIREVVKRTSGEEVKTYDPGIKRKFRYDEIKQEIAAGTAQHGFIFEYYFSAQAAFQVAFDGSGVAEWIGDIATVADLLDTREGG